jgi:hypothetical protein
MVAVEGSESDKEKIMTDSSPSCSSLNPTPPEYNEDNEKETKKTLRLPLTPPRKLSINNNMDVQENPLPLRTALVRRLSFPVRGILFLHI